MQTIDLMIQNGQILDVINKKILKTNVYIDKGKVIALGNQLPYSAKQIIDAHQQYLAPGFIDAHVHIESSMVTPSELGKVIIPMGVTTIVVDPHEIANVCGVAGIKYMMNDAKQSPLEVLVKLPSSVPATDFEHNGATLTAKDLHPLYDEPTTVGLAEVMDYPAVHNHNADMMAKIHDAIAHHGVVDGHGAGLNSAQLKEYRHNGITTDHESTNLAQMQDRLAADMNVFLREGTVERDLQNTIAAVNDSNSSRFSFCTDDKLISTIVKEGSINFNIQLAIQNGIDELTAYQMASYNAAQAHHLNQLGAIKEGYQADIVFIRDLDKVNVTQVIKHGKVIDDSDFATKPLPFAAGGVHQNIHPQDLRLPLEHDFCHVMGVIPNHIETTHLKKHVPVKDGYFATDLKQDILLMVDVERHHNLGTYGLSLVHGFKIKHGAVATTIAHDSHNIVAVGTSADAIYRAIDEVTKSHGGIAVVDEEKTLATMPLPIAGLMSNQPWSIASHQLEAISEAYQQISDPIDFDPFITLSFLTLPVIPTLKLTDQGLYDFDQQKFIKVNIDK